MKSVLICAALSLSICSAAASQVEIVAAAVTGRVVDQSGNGVARAVVAAKWVGTFSGFSESGTTCVKATALTADDRGYFTLPGWETKRASLQTVFASIVGYKPGFIADGFAAVDGKESGLLIRRAIALPKADVIVRLKPLTGEPEQRRAALARQLGGASCGGNDSADLRLLYQAMRQEVSALPPEATRPGNATLLEFVDAMLNGTFSSFGGK